MSKKDEAFELFNQGKAKNDPEVVALGLTKDSIRKYHREWSKLQLEAPDEEAEATPEAPVKEIPPAAPRVALSSLTIGANFEYDGKVYQKRDSTLTIISGLDLEATKRTQQMTWKGFSPKTLVTLK